MKEVFFLVEETIEGGFTGKGLVKSIFTEADTIEDIKREIKDSVLCHFMRRKCRKSSGFTW